MIIISHRGYCENFPENTIGAIEDALSLGINGVEIDIRLDSTGRPILFHDRTVNNKEVSSLSRRELSSIVGYDVPKLKWVLKTMEKSNYLLNIELKTPSTLSAVAELVENCDNNILITSSWIRLVEQFAKLCPDIPCGVIISHGPINFNFKNISHIIWCYENIEYIEQSKDMGYKNFIYDAITPTEHAELEEDLIDGVITDHPKMFKMS